MTNYSPMMKTFIVFSMMLIGFMSTMTIIITHAFIQANESNRAKSVSTMVENVKNQNAEVSMGKAFVKQYDELNQVVDDESDVKPFINDYPFEIENNYELYPEDVFDISLVTYTDVDSLSHLQSYVKQWAGPIVLVLHYSPSESSKATEFQSEAKKYNNLQVVPVPLADDQIPINSLKNIGIEAVSTTHFLFSEFNLFPSKSLYKILKSTPGYLWRDPYFVGVVPVFEWSSDAYDEAIANSKNESEFPQTVPEIKKCLNEYRCRPLQTTTVPMQFGTFSYTHYRNMNCVDTDTEIYMVLKKTEVIPRFTETVSERGFDNAEFVERIRYSSMKFGMLCSEYLFRVSGVGMDSDVVYSNMQKPSLRAQYDQIRLDHMIRMGKINPTITCNQAEPAMHSWIGFTKYVWLKEQTVDGVFYPKVAVRESNKVVLNL